MKSLINRFRKLNPWIRIPLGFCFFFILGHIGYTCYDGLHDEGRNADLALVLGNKVNKDGTLSEALEARMAHALAIYQSGRVKWILVSGGLGKEGYFEADKMKAYLIANGVPGNKIITDNQGNDTQASVKNALHIKDSLQLNSILAVSQYFHLTRTKHLFRNRGFTAISSSAPWYFQFRDLYALPREFAAYYLEK